MANDLANLAKGFVRVVISVAVGFLAGFEYYSFAPNQNEAVGVAVAMGFIATLVVFYVLHNLGKSSG